MKAFAISRRSAMAALAGTLATPLLANVGAAAQPGPRFRAIEVDVSAVRQSGDPVSAEWIARQLPALLQKSFAADLAPGDRAAPVLRVRIDSVTLGSNGSAGGGTSAFSAIDHIEGAGIVIGPGGRVVASYPLLTSLVASPDLNDITGNSTRLRISNLAQSFAQWLPGRLGA